MIKVDRIEEGLPISVIVPLNRKRQEFFNNIVLPLIEANNPREIIINDNDGTAPKKRNDGFKHATEQYVFFCDDDIVLPSNALEKMYDALEKNPNKGYAYCGYHGIVLHPHNHPMRGNFLIPSQPFNGSRLRQGNYISTMSLVRKNLFPMFDENLKRLQDYDIWLTLLNKGVEGMFMPDLKFYAFYLDEGITSNNNNEQEAIMAIIRKHNLGN